MANLFEDDEHAIEALVIRQFESLQWRPGKAGDWDGFSADFHPDATLYAKARPARPQSVPSFLARMKGLSETGLRRFEERFLGTKIKVFGTVAVAFSGCEFTENGSEVSRGVEAMLLVKEEGAWKIVSQAWDMETPDNPMPAEFDQSVPRST